MPRFRFTHPHCLSSEEARQRLQVLIRRFGNKYRFETCWTTATVASVCGRGVKGNVEVDEGRVHLDLDLPLLLLPLKAKIQDRITRKLATVLAKEPEAR